MVREAPLLHVTPHLRSTPPFPPPLPSPLFLSLHPSLTSPSLPHAPSHPISTSRSGLHALSVVCLKNNCKKSCDGKCLIQYNTIQYITLQYNTIQYNIMYRRTDKQTHGLTYPNSQAPQSPRHVNLLISSIAKVLQLDRHCFSPSVCVVRCSVPNHVRMRVRVRLDRKRTGVLYGCCPCE